MNRFTIAGREIGPGHPAYVIAELSANHGGDFDRACSLVRAAADAGADAVKYQTFTADTITLDVDNEYFRIDTGTIWDGATLHSLYAEAAMPWEWQPQLAAVATDAGIHWFSSPFDASAVAFLDGIGAPAFKVASLEIVDLPLLRVIARTGKPVIISTGLATLAEIEDAHRALTEAGADQIAILRTNSGYPAPPEEMDLLTIPDLMERFDAPIGLSDHTLGIAVPIAAVSLGAAIVEKHLTLSRDIDTPDREFSLEPAEFAEMVAGIRVAEAALGEIRYGPRPRETSSAKYRRSLFISADIKAGERFTADNVRSVRPGAGLAPKHIDDVLGRKAARDVAAGTPLSWDLIADVQ